MASMIPDNSTILYLNRLRNGSLYPQITSVYNNPNTTVSVYVGNSGDQGLNLSILADNVASLMFNASGFSISNPASGHSLPLASTFALASTLFDANATRFPLTCTFPVSGQYDTLNRALFYSLMIFSLVFRRHIWISVAALGTALVYAAVSAVHLLALVSLFDFTVFDDKTNPTPHDVESSKKFADIDIMGILPILAASAIMVTPILLWSTTVRKHDAQSIIVWWGALIFSSLSWLLWKLGTGGFNLNKLPSFAICNKGCIPEIDIASFTLTFDLYQKCNCMDFCGTLGPAAPMRKGSNMVAMLDHRSDKIIQKAGFESLYIVNLVALFFIIVYGLMGLIISRFSPDEVRNAIFRFFNSDLRLWLKVFFEGEREDRALAYFNVTEKTKRRTFWLKCKYVFAKLMALSFSLTAGAAAIICPAVFVSTVVANEILLQSYPLSEYSDAIGAWGTWVGALLVLFAAVINEYAGPWMKTLQIVVYAGWRHVVYSKADRKTLYPRREGWSVGTRLKLFGLVLISPPIHGWWTLARSFWTFRITLWFFLVWWKDTENVSQQRGKAIKLKWEEAEMATDGTGKPECRCYPCRHDREKEELEKKKHGQDGTDMAHLLSEPKSTNPASTVDPASNSPLLPQNIPVTDIPEGLPTISEPPPLLERIPTTEEISQSPPLRQDSAENIKPVAT